MRNDFFHKMTILLSLFTIAQSVLWASERDSVAENREYREYRSDKNEAKRRHVENEILKLKLSDLERQLGELDAKEHPKDCPQCFLTKKQQVQVAKEREKLQKEVTRVKLASLNQELTRIQEEEIRAECPLCFTKTTPSIKALGQRLRTCEAENAQLKAKAFPHENARKQKNGSSSDTPSPTVRSVDEPEAGSTK